jgi:hypothetical protein
MSFGGASGLKGTTIPASTASRISRDAIARFPSCIPERSWSDVFVS